MKLINTLIFLFLFNVTIYGDPPMEAIKVAQADIQSERFIKRIKWFSKTSNAKRSDFSLGEPLKFYRIHDRELYKWDKNLIKLTDIKPMWIFPIKEKGRILFWLGIKLKNDKWVSDGGGYTAIAPELDNILSSWPRTEGYTPIIIDAFKCGAYFHIPQINDYNLTRILPTTDGKGRLIKFKIDKLKYSRLEQFTDFRKTYENIYTKKSKNNGKE